MAQTVQTVVDYHFGPYRFDGRLRRLYRDGEPIAVTPKAADTLVALIERAGRVVEKDEILRVVWGEISVGDDTLAQNISTLRRVLGDDPNRPQFIATVPRRGYRFLAAVRTVAPLTDAADTPNAGRLTPVVAGATTTSTRRRAALVAAVVLVAALTAIVAPRWSVKDPPRGLVQFTVDAPESHRFSTSGGMLALSPDGRYLSFVAVDVHGSSSLWLRPLGSTESRKLEGTDGAAQPFWSPDSTTLGFFSGRRLKSVDVTSGVVRVIASLSSPRSLGGTWSRDGRILFSVPGDGVYLVPASGGSPQRLAVAPATRCEGCVAWPHLLPDRRRFLYTVAGADASESGIYVGEVGSSSGVRLLDVVSSSSYVAPGLLSFARSGTLYLQPFDIDRLRLTGDPVPLTDSVASNVRTGRVVASVSDTGVMAFRKPMTTELVWVDRAGTLERVAASAAIYLSFAIAPDGRRIAAARIDPRTGTSDVWVIDNDREVRITDDPGWDGDPVWSADGTAVVYSSHRGAHWRIHRRPVSTVGPEELLLDSDSPVSPLQVTNATRVIYAARAAVLPFDVWQLDRGSAAPVGRIGGFYPSDARVSPDGRWWACGMPETGAMVAEQALYVSATPDRRDRRALADAASLPRWRADGRELFYISKDSSVVAIPIDPGRTPSESAGRVLFRTPALGPSGVSDHIYDVSPDGQRFLVKREAGSSPIHVVVNWDAQFAR